MNLILFLAALVVAFLIFGWLLKVVKATFSAAFTIAFIALILMVFFGIGPEQLFQEVQRIFQSIWDFVTGAGQ